MAPSYQHTTTANKRIEFKSQGIKPYNEIDGRCEFIKQKSGTNNIRLTLNTTITMAVQPTLLSMASSAEKMTNTSYSPTTVFAVDELHSVFRASDGRGLIQAPSIPENVHGLAKKRTNSSFATDGEMSTFSEDDDEDIVSSITVGIPLRRAALSIFRPISGTKRPHCLLVHSSSDDEMDIGQKNIFKSPADDSSTPLVSRANPIRSEESDDESSNKRLRRTPSSAFSEPDSHALLTPQYLQHPLSFESWSRAHGLKTEEDQTLVHTL